jgi:23S rRNA-/tRNA-specific pseudouridylate synthase
VTPIALLDLTPHEIVLWKPPGLASELPRDPAADSLVTRLRAQGFDNLRLVHRLDSPACGVMIVARTAEAAAHYAAEIAARRWQKFYVADVASPIADAQKLLGSHKAYLSTRGRKAEIVRSGGKPSFLTILHAAATVGAPARSDVFVHLHTGRFHQIRAMLAALDAPLAGDAVYGAAGEGDFYLEHVLLAARPFGQDRLRVWQAPPDERRRPWPASLVSVVKAQADALLSEA